MEKSGFFWTLKKVIFRQKNEGFGGGKLGFFELEKEDFWVEKWGFLGFKTGDF